MNEFAMDKKKELVQYILHKCLKSSFQGANASQLEKEIGSDQFPANEHYFGLVNVSNFLPKKKRKKEKKQLP